MKKIMIVLALLASFQVANAQAGPAAAKKALDAALAASQNAKKATKVATWMKLAESYVEAYNAPSGNEPLDFIRHAFGRIEFFTGLLRSSQEAFRLVG